MNNTLSLINIMREDPDLQKRLAKKVQAVKEDKAHLLAAADDYGQKYQQEILEGTEKRANLLSEGARQGKSEEEVSVQHGKFIPTVYTPVLNLLYFLLRESKDEEANIHHQQRRAYVDEKLLQRHQTNHPEDGSDEWAMEDLISELEGSTKEDTRSPEWRKQINEEFGREKINRPSEDNAKLKDTPEMTEFLYGNITLDTFNLIKKLKALATSSNEQEAFLAFRKANDLCKKYNLDFDRIPCYIKGE